MSAVKETVKDFNAKFPIGTPCSFLMPSGAVVKTKTWSHAGLGRRDVPCVFVEAVMTPIVLDNIKIDGYELVIGKRK